MSQLMQTSKVWPFACSMLIHIFYTVLFHEGEAHGLIWINTASVLNTGQMLQVEIKEIIITAVFRAAVM